MKKPRRISPGQCHIMTKIVEQTKNGTSMYIQYVYFQSLRENAQRGAASPIRYRLTLSCMEFFIARKIRPVFEVYRQVMHRTHEA